MLQRRELSCRRTIMSRNTDARFYKTMDGAREKVNFLIFCDIDDEEVKTVLRADVYLRWRR